MSLNTLTTTRVKVNFPKTDKPVILYYALPVPFNSFMIYQYLDTIKDKVQEDIAKKVLTDIPEATRQL